MRAKSYHISAIECRGGRDEPQEVRWCDLSTDIMQIGHDLLHERPLIDKQLPWGLILVGQDNLGRFYQATIPPTGGWEPVKGRVR